MFKFLREGLKKTISKLTGKIEEKAEGVNEETSKEELKEEILDREEKIDEKKKGFLGKLKDKVIRKEEIKVEDKEPEVKEEDEKPKEEKKGIIKRVAEKVITKKLSDKDFDELFDDLEMVLLENNVAFEVIDKIKGDLRNELVDKPLRRGKIGEAIKNSLKESIEDLFLVNIDLIKEVKKKKPYVICFVGINGSGKTTTIAKIAHLLKKNDISCVIAASDTFRAASIEQLEEHADKLGVKLIKHDYGSDGAAVAFDAIKHAEAKNKDVVLIDTAGRLHSNIDLMREMEKIIRVAKPDMVIFVGESITGNDCVEQAKKFSEHINVDGVILTKADVDEKGGAAISITYIIKRPILYLGVGQKYDDLEKFDSEKIIGGLGL